MSRKYYEHPYDECIEKINTLKKMLHEYRDLEYAYPIERVSYLKDVQIEAFSILRVVFDEFELVDKTRR